MPAKARGRRGTQDKNTASAPKDAPLPQALVARFTSNARKALLDYWDVGRTAAQTQPGGNLDGLGKQLGVKRDTLHYAIQFSQLADRTVVKKLSDRKIAWRAVVDWLRIQDPAASEKALAWLLNQEQCNSSEFKRFIHQQLQKKPIARVPKTFQDACARWNADARNLTASLTEFDRIYLLGSTQFGGRAGGPARKQLRELKGTLEQAQEAIGTTLENIDKITAG